MTSLGDRITEPENGPEPEASIDTTTSAPLASPIESKSWADEANSAAEAAPVSAEVKANAEKEMNELSKAQTDGAGGDAGGSTAMIEPTYDVDVKLSDLQADPNDPLYSAKSFDQLGLYIHPPTDKS